MVVVTKRTFSKMTTRQAIINAAKKSLALRGYDGSSIRDIAKDVGIEPSAIYYHFANKEKLIKAARDDIINELRNDTLAIDTEVGASNYLREQIKYQLRHRASIVALLQYFMYAKSEFELKPGGYIPDMAYEDMVTYIRLGIREGVYPAAQNIEFNAKVIQHLVDGFLMEYFNRKLTAIQIDELTNQLADFIDSALRGINGK